MTQIKQFYEFEDFRLDLTNKVLMRNGENIPITRKMFETLFVLVENADRLMEKDELMQRIWHDRFVEESNLTFNIKMLRKALGDAAGSPRFIETVPRRGYRFIARVKEDGGQNNNFRPAPPQSAAIFKSSYLSAAVLLTLLLASLGLTAWIWKGNSREATAPILAAGFDSTKLSDTGKVYHAIISPNGQYVVYTNKVGSKESLWLRHLETANNTQIIPPSDDNYFGLAFSNDGETIFFMRKSGDYVQPIAIYRIPLMGGVPTKVTDRSQGWISLSPDDKQISFVRYDDNIPNYNRLMLVDSDGKNEREIKVSEAPNAFWTNAFSPDGKTVAAAYGHSRNASRQMGLVEIDIETSEQRELTAEKFFHIKDLKWLPNKSGLIFSASHTINDKSRLWKLDYQTKKVSLISKDTLEYSGLSLTRNADVMVATTFTPDFHLYLQNSDNRQNFSRLTQARDKFTFAPDGKIVYATDTAGNEDIWIMDADGSHQRQLTTDKSLDFAPLVSPANSYIFYTSNRSGESQIWRINADGSNQIQITRKEGGYPRFVSPDGRWLYYQSALENKLRKVSTDGGEEVLFDEDYGYYQAFSPDGKLLAFLFREPGTNKIKLKVVAPESRKILKTFDTPGENSSVLYFLRWRNNTTLAYTIEENNAPDSLWEQELSKDKPQMRYDLGNEEIMDIQYSADGEKFSFIRGSWQHDAFLIKGLK
jgi:Tol biopolymer transport system component/DNA-binding winged helix-turn-helix (wHTH) protein